VTSRLPDSSGRMRAAVAALVWSLVFGSAPHVLAQSNGVPEGRYAVVLAGRENAGALAERFERGWLWGFEAGWQPSWLGLAWSWSQGFFTSSDAGVVETELRLTEMNFNLRGRIPVSRLAARFLIASFGLGLLRANIPIPPDAGREYAGLFVGLGMEQLLGGRYMLAVEGRYGLFDVPGADTGLGGPAGLTVSLSLAFGSK
jgi:hypothetical protein